MRKTPHRLALIVALAEIGVAQTPAGQYNPRITQYHEGANIRGYNDKASWCSSFVNWCLDQVGIVVLSCDDPSGWKGHVGFYLRSDDAFMYMRAATCLNRCVSIVIRWSLCWGIAGRPAKRDKTEKSEAKRSKSRCFPSPV